MREAFGTDEYQILLVANKFQTGFDQPLLCGMYVDRRLAGIQAVQTSRARNRGAIPEGHDLHWSISSTTGGNPGGIQDLPRHGDAGRPPTRKPGVRPTG